MASYFATKTLRATLKIFDVLAARKLSIEKESSDVHVRMIPKKTGTKHKYTRGWKTLPRTTVEAMAFSAGSPALMTYVKDTAAVLTDITVPQ